jgi:hypothetical protein
MNSMFVLDPFLLFAHWKKKIPLILHLHIIIPFHLSFFSYPNEIKIIKLYLPPMCFIKIKQINGILGKREDGLGL